MTSRRPPLFHKRWFEPTVIVTCVRFYLRFLFSLRDVKELMAVSMAVTAVKEIPNKGRHTLMAFRPLNSFFLTADEVLSADLEQLGEALLAHLNSYEGQVKQNGRFCHDYLLGMLENNTKGLGTRPPGYDYDARQIEVTRRVMEAWNWLERQGLIVPDPPSHGWHVISTEGQRLLTKLARYESWLKGDSYVRRSFPTAPSQP